MTTPESLGPDAGALFLTALSRRFACKRYDPERHVSDSDFRTIMDAARLSASSFGMEPWHFLVIENQEVLEGLLSRAWGAKRNASRTVVILARKNVVPGSTYMDHMITDIQGLSASDKDAKLSRISEFQAKDFELTTAERVFAWARRQTFIPLANMLSAAGLLDIDATPVEGFDEAKVNEFLAEKGLVDPGEFGVSVLVQFGYASADHMPVHKTRRPEEESTTIVR